MFCLKCVQGLKTAKVAVKSHMYLISWFFNFVTQSLKLRNQYYYSLYSCKKKRERGKVKKWLQIFVCEWFTNPTLETNWKQCHKFSALLSKSSFGKEEAWIWYWKLGIVLGLNKFHCTLSLINHFFVHKFSRIQLYISIRI